jgi:methyltransferase (TIGR00027 family)
MTQEPENIKTSIEDQPSETALIVASLRALTVYDDREEIRGKDYLAEIFLPEDRKKPLIDQTVRELVMKAIPAGMYEYIIARTACFDFIVEESLRENIPQIVFLGAGYDSRPYRFIKQIKTTKIYELDAKPTQDRKLTLLHQSKIAIPESLSFIPINFNTDSLEVVLAKAGYDKNKKTLFIWEGVTFYLPAKSVDNTLSFIVDNAPIGSELCFDFQSYSPSLSGQEHNLQTNIPGESIQFGIEAGKTKTFLSDRGFQIIEHYTNKDMEDKYLALKNGSIFGNISAILNIVHVSNAGK